MPDPENQTLDPAATDETSANARDGAKKRRDPNEPAAVVGLGASAGGVSVLQQFFADMPVESGLAFVVVMHLSPEHESNLAPILQQRTSMPVVQVTEPVKVKPNHVYVIPPNKQLTFEDSTLHLVEPQQGIGRRVTIDLFFRTLAQSFGQRSVCVVLSGSDSDGTIGLKHIRAHGGVTIAQDPSEAEHDSMPSMAISTGMVDWILPVAQMPGKLMEFVRNEHAMRLPPEIPDAPLADVKVEDAPGGETVSDETRDHEDEEALVDVLAHVRTHTGHDFSHYKRATVLRRIARRMQVNSVESIPQYLAFLRTHPAEARALFQDLLIGVTHFFRDREAFAALQAHIPQLFAGKRREDQVRVWVAGCATGEEAYSIAMLLCEHAERLSNPPKIQVFASDIDEQAISDARDALYPVTIEADVSLERLRQFFVKDHGLYRVRKELREMVLFAVHDVMKDAPFSRVDLISCRNLLIYLSQEAQDRLFDICHFSLRAGGLLFIGTAEGGQAAQTLFAPIDGKTRLYVRRSVPRPTWQVPHLPLRTPNPAQRTAVEPRPRRLRALSATQAETATTETPQTIFDRQERRSVLFGELHLRLLEEYGPPSAVVNETNDLVHLSAKAGRYLQFVAGEPSANVVALVRPELRTELRTALFRAAQTSETVKGTPIAVEIEGNRETVVLEVRPVRAKDSEHGYFLILFGSGETRAHQLTAAEHTESGSIASELENEIQFLKQQLAHTVEQYEATSEELKASNEELQAMNEEMRSTTAELETSKEELQSVNEELVTVNNELKSSIEDLSRTNTDLNNLMASTDIGTIFLDRQLRIARFTPAAQKLFNLIPSDLGRPLSDITHRLKYQNFIDDAETVLSDLKTIEQEVQVGDEKWSLLRIAPYRTAEDRIAGVVATFIDITRRRHAEEALRESEERMRRLADAIPQIVWTNDCSGIANYFNRRWYEFTGLSYEESRGPGWQAVVHPEDARTSVARWKSALAKGEVFESEYRLRNAAGEYRWFIGRNVPLRDDADRVIGWFGSATDIHDLKVAEAARRELEERFHQFGENSADVLWMINAETQKVEYVSPAYEKVWGEPRDAIMHDLARWREMLHPEDHDEVVASFDRIVAGETLSREYRIVRAGDGSIRWLRDVGFPIRDMNGKIVRVGGIAQDITTDKEHTEAIRSAEERFRLLVDGARDYAMFLLDSSNKITYWSRGAERIFGWTREEAVGQDGGLIFTPEDKAKGAVEKEIDIALQTGACPDRRWHLRKGGAHLWVDGIMRRLDHDDGTLRGFAKVARDASDQRAIEDALRHAKEEMEQRVIERTRDLLATNNELERTMSQRQQLEKELLEISEREKRRIGEDLHDMVCQELTATALFLKSTSKALASESPTSAERLDEAAQIVNRNVGLTRDLARGLQPAELTGAGLKTALKLLADQACENTGIKCHFKATRGVRVTDDTVALHLYRITQEAVKNAVKHAGAKNVLITLDKTKDLVCVSVEDDGKGFKPTRRSKGLGLHIMRYRANALGGELEILRRKRGGTEVRCKMPIKRA